MHGLITRPYIPLSFFSSDDNSNRPLDVITTDTIAKSESSVKSSVYPSMSFPAIQYNTPAVSLLRDPK